MMPPSPGRGYGPRIAGLSISLCSHKKNIGPAWLAAQI
ncbi:hypothetical protein SAMN05878503_12150 [Cereibacter ovatus]|uniref:Uncharacterized protein n=1 Tax=Cereibacter ovatus TaxID=439529 RepID=A0A285D3C1_9RHOB|nr:hypothetical protein SAMN05878503_12150 [Cereibacter ovatus]